jgi:hypothetical protein
MDVPRMYGNKSTIHRLRLKLCETWAYEKIFGEMRSRCYLNGNIDLSFMIKLDANRPIRIIKDKYAG